MQQENGNREILRVKREETMLLARFGEQYSSYMERTDNLLPRIKRFASSNRQYPKD